LFIVLSLFTVYLFTLGYAAGPFLRRQGGWLEQLALAVAAGILINYCLMLTGLTLTSVFVAGGILSAVGVVRLISDLRARQASTTTRFRESALWAGCIGYVLLVYYFQILSEPLIRWDARSVWFFHAKMIFTEGAFRHHGGWDHPSVAFSNPDYPTLVPAMAAQLAHLKGYWNEFLPKASLLVMLLPLVLWVFSFRRRSISFLLLVLLFFSSLNAWLWNGYMDAYLAMYCGASLLLFGRYLDEGEGRDTDLYSGMCAVGIACGTKNEGLLFALCVLTGLFVVSLRTFEASLRHLLTRLRTDVTFVTMFLIAVGPAILWAVLKKFWGLESRVVSDLPGGLGRVSTRLSDGVSLLYLFNFLTRRATVLWALSAILALTLLFSIHRRVKMPRAAALAATTALLYFCGMFAVYLSTPWSLTWHLLTSATRTMVTVSFGFLISLHFLLSALETSEARAGATALRADPAAVPPASRSARSGS
jgi:hypothetical protein